MLLTLVMSRDTVNRILARSSAAIVPSKELLQRDQSLCAHFVNVPLDESTALLISDVATKFWPSPSAGIGCSWRQRHRTAPPAVSQRHGELPPAKHCRLSKLFSRRLRHGRDAPGDRLMEKHSLALGLSRGGIARRPTNHRNQSLVTECQGGLAANRGGRHDRRRGWRPREGPRRDCST